MPSATKSLLSLFLPEFILDNFEFTNIIEDPDTFHIQLEELNSLPTEWGSIKVQSKGFWIIRNSWGVNLIIVSLAF